MRAQRQSRQRKLDRRRLSLPLAHDLLPALLRLVRTVADIQLDRRLSFSLLASRPSTSSSVVQLQQAARGNLLARKLRARPGRDPSAPAHRHRSDTHSPPASRRATWRTPRASSCGQASAAMSVNTYISPRIILLRLQPPRRVAQRILHRPHGRAQLQPLDAHLDRVASPNPARVAGRPDRRPSPGYRPATDSSSHSASSFAFCSRV